MLSDKSLLLCISLSYFKDATLECRYSQHALGSLPVFLSTVCQHPAQLGASPAGSSGVPLELTSARGNFEHELWHPGPLPFGYTEEWEILLKTVPT